MTSYKFSFECTHTHTPAHIHVENHVSILSSNIPFRMLNLCTFLYDIQSFSIHTFVLFMQGTFLGSMHFTGI